MIDIENRIYTLLQAALSVEGVNEVSSVYRETQDVYPYVFIQMINNSVDQKGSDSARVENFAKQDFQIDIFTDGDNRKTRAKAIGLIVDDVLSELGLRRSFYSFLPNLLDNSIGRLVIRYKGIVDTKNKIYGGI